MPDNLRILPEAERDIADAFNWYEDRGKGVGDHFLRQVKTCLDSIASQPESRDLVHGNFRRALVNRFPYLIFYETANDTVTVCAVLHGSRDPKTWQARLPDE